MGYSNLLWQVNKTMSDPMERRSIAAHVGPDSRYSGMTRTGYMMLPPAFSAEQVADLREFCAARPCYDVDGCTSHLLIHDIMSRPEIIQSAIAHREIALRYLGCEPILAAVAAFWTHPQGNDVGLNVWHRDRDDFRAIKIFIYLSDVDEDAGPHQFIPGTHLSGGPKQFYEGNARAHAEEIQSHYKDMIKTFTGPAGTTWAENTYGLHRGLKPTKKSRGVLEFLYTQNAYPEHRSRFDGLTLKNPELTHLFQHLT